MSTGFRIDIGQPAERVEHNPDATIKELHAPPRLVAGCAIGHVASLHPNMVKVSVPIWAVLLAIGFSNCVGIIFGIIPAFIAAILHPIDTLRHE